MEIIKFFKAFPRLLKTSISDMIGHASQAVVSTLIMTVMMILIGCSGLIYMNVTSFSESVKGTLSIYVQLNEDLTDEQGMALNEQFASIPNVQSVTFSSKEQELEKIINNFNDLSNAFESYRGEANPCGPAYEITVNDAAYLEEVTAKIREFEEVNLAQYGGENAKQLVDFLTKVNVGMLVFLAFITFVTVIVMAGSFTQSINSRKDEYELMRLVGASNWYIRTPVILEGFIYAIFTASLAFFIIQYGYAKLYATFGGIFVSGMFKLVDGNTVLPYVGGIMVGIGIIISYIASSISLRKSLKK